MDKPKTDKPKTDKRKTDKPNTPNLKPYTLPLKHLSNAPGARPTVHFDDLALAEQGGSERASCNGGAYPTAPGAQASQHPFSSPPPSRGGSLSFIPDTLARGGQAREDSEVERSSVISQQVQGPGRLASDSVLVMQRRTQKLVRKLRKQIHSKQMQAQDGGDEYGPGGGGGSDGQCTSGPPSDVCTASDDEVLGQGGRYARPDEDGRQPPPQQQKARAYSDDEVLHGEQQRGQAAPGGGGGGGGAAPPSRHTSRFQTSRFKPAAHEAEQPQGASPASRSLQDAGRGNGGGRLEDQPIDLKEVSELLRQAYLVISAEHKGILNPDPGSGTAVKGGRYASPAASLGGGGSSRAAVVVATPTVDYGAAGQPCEAAEGQGRGMEQEPEAVAADGAAPPAPPPAAAAAAQQQHSKRNTEWFESKFSEMRLAVAAVQGAVLQLEKNQQLAMEQSGLGITTVPDGSGVAPAFSSEATLGPQGDQAPVMQPSTPPVANRAVAPLAFPSPVTPAELKRPDLPPSSLVELLLNPVTTHKVAATEAQRQKMLTVHGYPVLPPLLPGDNAAEWGPALGLLKARKEEGQQGGQAQPRAFLTSGLDPAGRVVDPGSEEATAGRRTEYATSMVGQPWQPDPACSFYEPQPGGGAHYWQRRSTPNSSLLSLITPSRLASAASTRYEKSPSREPSVASTYYSPMPPLFGTGGGSRTPSAADAHAGRAVYGDAVPAWLQSTVPDCEAQYQYQGGRCSQQASVAQAEAEVQARAAQAKAQAGLLMDGNSGIAAAEHGAVTHDQLVAALVRQQQQQQHMARLSSGTARYAMQEAQPTDQPAPAYAAAHTSVGGGLGAELQQQLWISGPSMLPLPTRQSIPPSIMANGQGGGYDGRDSYIYLPAPAGPQLLSGRQQQQQQPRGPHAAPPPPPSPPPMMQLQYAPPTRPAAQGSYQAGPAKAEASQGGGSLEDMMAQIKGRDYMLHHVERSSVMDLINESRVNTGSLAQGRACCHSCC